VSVNLQSVREGTSDFQAGAPVGMVQQECVGLACLAKVATITRGVMDMNSDSGCGRARDTRDMRILIVDDCLELCALVTHFLRQDGYKDIAAVASAEAAYEVLGLTNPRQEPRKAFDLILLDIDLPGTHGIEACRRINADPRFADVPIVMVSVSADMASLQESFAAGAIDYITKPIHRRELLTRVGAAARLKLETERINARERELLEAKQGLESANQELERLSRIDALTGIANRRCFEEALEQEWSRMKRGDHALSLLLLDLDEFKRYNDSCGHQEGDECLRTVAQALASAVRRSSDLVARYGGEEFAVILPHLGEEGALEMAWTLNRLVSGLAIGHASSRVADIVTVSIGVATVRSKKAQAAKALIAQADAALYRSKAAGRNCVTHAREVLPDINDRAWEVPRAQFAQARIQS
jgi:diguanylate cyclase (GGDEF)-like protein